MKKRGKTVIDNDLNTSGGTWGHFFGGVTVGTLATLGLAVAAAAVHNKKEDDKKANATETSYIPPTLCYLNMTKKMTNDPYPNIYPYPYK